MLKERTRDLLCESGRITPREVLEAYEATGLRPVREVFDNKAGGVCGLTVVAAAKGEWPNGELLPEDAVMKVLERTMTHEAADRYIDGFMYGFDKEEEDEDASAWERKGFRDGRRAARAVFGEHSR